MLPTWPTPDPRTATVLFRQSLTTLTSQGRVRPSTLRLRRPPAHAYACVFLDRHVPAPSRSRCDQRSQPSLCDGSALATPPRAYRTTHPLVLTNGTHDDQGRPQGRVVAYLSHIPSPSAPISGALTRQGSYMGGTPHFSRSYSPVCLRYLALKSSCEPLNMRSKRATLT
jgi:hypothetical protein